MGSGRDVSDSFYGKSASHREKAGNEETHKKYQKCFSGMADGKGTKYENKDVVSKLVEDDGGNMTIYAQWKKKKKLCLKVSSNSYLKSLINPAAEALAKNWFGKNNNTLVENMMNKSDKDCVQVWSVSREGISRTR